MDADYESPTDIAARAGWNDATLLRVILDWLEQEHEGVAEELFSHLRALEAYEELSAASNEPPDSPSETDLAHERTRDRYGEG